MLARSVEQVGVRLARRTSRRSFLGKLGRGFVALAGGSFVAAALSPERAHAFHICGHIFTTGSCPHPFAPNSRVDNNDYPVHPDYGYPVDDQGIIYTSPTQTRRKICRQWVPGQYPFVPSPRIQGSWSRCCGGRIRKITDCCSRSDIRINGDAALHGYCYRHLKVFCITYRDLNVPC